MGVVICHATGVVVGGVAITGGVCVVCVIVVVIVCWMGVRGTRLVGCMV